MATSEETKGGSTGGGAMSGLGTASGVAGTGDIVTGRGGTAAATVTGIVCGGAIGAGEDTGFLGRAISKPKATRLSNRTAKRDVFLVILSLQTRMDIDSASVNG
jgi:hypothetical protein